MKELQQTFENVPKIAFFPLLRHIIPEHIGYSQVLNFYKRQKELFWGILQDREKDFDHESPPKVWLFKAGTLNISLSIKVQENTAGFH